jgi:hypothetical protein
VSIVPPGQIIAYDISWPQCGKAWPADPVAFAIIGINNGRPYTANPCFIDEYRWARRFESDPAVYLNVDFPKAGVPQALSGPYGQCKDTDDWCRAYNYGYGLAAEVVERARRLSIAPSRWWLDVETGNFWSLDATYNAQVIRGTIDYFKERGLPAGIYSTPRQWRTIAGPYAPGLVNWTAGAQGIEGAAARCFDPAYAFGGGQVLLVQYYDYSLDTNYACPNGSTYGTVSQPGTGASPLPRSGAPAPELRKRSIVPMLSVADP